MPDDLGGDLGVDVLIIGGGIQGLYLAEQLKDTYSVCVVTDPKGNTESLMAHGMISAGYWGNDIDRIQPARRTSSFWRAWLIDHGVRNDFGPSYYAVSPEELALKTRVWDGATLPYKSLQSLPEIFAGGDLGAHTSFLLEAEVSVNPGALLTELRRGLEDRIIEGVVVRFGVFGDDIIDHVIVDLGEGNLPIVPRFVVLAAGYGNADLMDQLASRFKTQERRKSAKLAVQGSQAVRSMYVLCCEGPDLPLLSGVFGDLWIVGQPLSNGSTVWLISPPPDDAATTKGVVDSRFEPPLDPDVVANTLKRLFAAAPRIERIAPQLQWSVYVGRKIEHPQMAAADTRNLPQPVSAHLDALGMEKSFLALWPSHLGYSMVLGDVAAERIRNALGRSGDFRDGPQTSDFANPSPEPLLARWDRPDFPWSDWNAFSATYK